MSGISWDAIAFQHAHAEAVGTKRAWEKHTYQLQGRVQNLEAQVAGLMAVIEGFKRLHPDSPFLRNSEEVYTDAGDDTGTQKTFLRLTFEQGFDKAMLDMGIPNPKQYRED